MCYEEAHSGAEDGVAGKVIAGGDARKANGSRQTVGDEGNPSMPAITVSDDSRNGHG